MKVAIVGSRGYYPLSDVVEFVAALPADTEIVSGGARGVDRTAEKAARSRGLEVLIIKPEWKRLGRTAGFMRNHDIIESADRVVAFWDGSSKGTAHAIELAWQAGKPCEVRR